MQSYKFCTRQKAVNYYLNIERKLLNPYPRAKLSRTLTNIYRAESPISGFKSSKKLFGDLDGWIRSRLRSMQLKKWKNPHKFRRIIIDFASKPQEAHRVWIRMNKWQSVHRRAVRFVMNLKWFKKQGLFFLNDFTKRLLELPLFNR